MKKWRTTTKVFPRTLAEGRRQKQLLWMIMWENTKEGDDSVFLHFYSIDLSESSAFTKSLLAPVFVLMMAVVFPFLPIIQWVQLCRLVSCQQTNWSNCFPLYLLSLLSHPSFLLLTSFFNPNHETGRQTDKAPDGEHSLMGSRLSRQSCLAQE